MIASEFSQFVDELIPELSPHLPGVAAEYLSEQGSGAIKIELHDADEPQQRSSVISYLPHDLLPVGSHIRQLTSEYDPRREIVLQVVMDRMVVTRKLSLTDLRRQQPMSHEALET